MYYAFVSVLFFYFLIRDEYVCEWECGIKSHALRFGSHRILRRGRANGTEEEKTEPSAKNKLENC